MSVFSQEKATSPNGRIELVVKNPLYGAGVGQGWVMPFHVVSELPFKVEVLTSDSTVVTGKVRLDNDTIVLSVVAGSAQITVKVTDDAGEVAEVSWQMDTIMMGG